VSIDYTENGQADKAQPDEVKPDTPAGDTDEPTLTLAEKKAKITAWAEGIRTGLLAEIDQLQAKANAIENVASVQIAEIESEIKQLRAEVRNMEKIHGLGEKVVTTPGKPKDAAPVAAKKAAKRS